MPLSPLSRYAFRDFKSFGSTFEKRLLNVSVIVTSPDAGPVPRTASAIIDAKSIVVLWICSGYSDSVSSSSDAIYALTPLEIARISAMPMMPMEPAKDVKIVRAFFVQRF